MPSLMYEVGAWAILLVHVVIVIFNVAGMIVIPLGAWLGWGFVRLFGWRLIHLLSMAIVALQAIIGEACFLTLWQETLEEQAGHASETTPLLYRWINALLFWPLPLWVFALIYVAALIHVLTMWRLVPPKRVLTGRRPAGVRILKR